MKKKISNVGHAEVIWSAKVVINYDELFGKAIGRLFKSIRVDKDIRDDVFKINCLETGEREVKLVLANLQLRPEYIVSSLKPNCLPSGLGPDFKESRKIMTDFSFEQAGMHEIIRFLNLFSESSLRNISVYALREQMMHRHVEFIPTAFRFNGNSVSFEPSYITILPFLKNAYCLGIEK